MSNIKKIKIGENAYDIDAKSVDGHTVEQTGVASNTTTLPTTAQVKAYVDEHSGSNSDIGYIELSSTSGTLTDAQYTECLKDVAIIRIYSSSNTTYDFYYKQSDNSTYLYFLDIRYKHNAVTNNYYRINNSYIIITKNSKSFSLVDGDYIEFYNKSQTDTLLSGKQSTITGGATTITSDNLTANKVLVSNASGKVAVSSVSSTELGYLSGITSAVQTQINGKLNLSDVTVVNMVDKTFNASTSLGYTGYSITIPANCVYNLTLKCAYMNDRPLTVAWCYTDIYNYQETSASGGDYAYGLSTTATGYSGSSGKTLYAFARYGNSTTNALDIKGYYIKLD